MSDTPTRRQIVSRLGAAGALAALPSATLARTPTPAQAEGPFYPTSPMRFADQDADLVKVAEKVAEAGGEIILLRGVVTDVQGQPLANARVEIWQVDMNARYLHTGDRARAARDPNFQGYGVAQSDAEGRFVFRTIKPVPYPGRPPHIHAKITAAGRQVTTQFYIKDHPLNARDGSFRRLSAAQKEMVSMSFVATEQGEVADITVIL